MIGVTFICGRCLFAFFKTQVFFPKQFLEYFRSSWKKYFICWLHRVGSFFVGGKLKCDDCFHNFASCWPVGIGEKQDDQMTRIATFHFTSGRWNQRKKKLGKHAENRWNRRKDREIGKEIGRGNHSSRRAITLTESEVMWSMISLPHWLQSALSFVVVPNF